MPTQFNIMSQRQKNMKISTKYVSLALTTNIFFCVHVLMTLNYPRKVCSKTIKPVYKDHPLGTKKYGLYRQVVFI